MVGVASGSSSESPPKTHAPARSEISRGASRRGFIGLFGLAKFVILNTATAGV
jgi:hypothetical protein